MVIGEGCLFQQSAHDDVDASFHSAFLKGSPDLAALDFELDRGKVDRSGDRLCLGREVRQFLMGCAARIKGGYRKLKDVLSDVARIVLTAWLHLPDFGGDHRRVQDGSQVAGLAESGGAFPGG